MGIIDELLIKEKKNELEVEDLLDLVKSGNSSLIPGLKILKLEIAKNDSYSIDSVPYDRWIEIISEFLQYSYHRLVEIAISNKDLAQFAIAVLETTKSLQGLNALSEILASYDLNDSINYQNSVKCITAINIMISFDDEIKFSEKEADIIRSLIHRFLNSLKEKSLSESDAVIAYCALRKIGNLETIDYIKRMPPLKKAENGDIVKMVISTIKKRINKSNNGS